MTGDSIKEILPAPNSSLCSKILAWFRGLELLFNWFSWAFNSDGSPTDDFKNAIGVTTGTLSPPVNLAASQGTFMDHINLTWDPASGATYYEIFRSSSNDNTSAVSLGTSVTPSFTDSTAAANVTYWYFVKSRNATQTSGFSQGISGFTDTSGGHGSGATGSRILAPGDTWIVPVGVTTVQAEVWGPGGGGGGSNCNWCVAGSAFYSGGGGGSGEYMFVKNIPVAAGQVLSMAGGTAGAHGSATQSGSAGQTSSLRRAGVDLVLANAGAGGGLGNFNQTGAGGAGGTGGSNTVGVLDTQTAGNAGTGGTSAFPVPAGGAGGAAVGGGSNTGGNGGSNSSGQNGSPGQIKLTWPTT